MEPKDLPISPPLLFKGKALKIEACHIFSFSEKEKEKMSYFCNCLELSDNTYNAANNVYLSFLRSQINVGVLTPIPDILACIYIAALITGEERSLRKLSMVSEKSTAIIRRHKDKILMSIPDGYSFFSQPIEGEHININRLEMRNNLISTSDRKKIIKKFQLKNEARY